MKTWLLGGLCTLLALQFLSASASAHVLQENNGVSAVLHIDPDDNPEAAVPTKLQLAFGEQNGTFSLKQASHLRVDVLQQGKQLQQVPVTPVTSDDTSGVAVVTFPKVGIYQVVVSGSTPQVPSFQLVYTERVATVAGATNESATSSLQVVLISLVSLIIVAIVGSTYIAQGGRYNKTRRN